jgi:hypothetical protein
LVGVCAWFAAESLELRGTPHAETAAAPTPSPAYFKISRRVVTLAPGYRWIIQAACKHHARADAPAVCFEGKHTAKRII